MTKPRTCCTTHRDSCDFGRQHSWTEIAVRDSSRPVNPDMMPGDWWCARCEGYCTTEREK